MLDTIAPNTTAPQTTAPQTTAPQTTAPQTTPPNASNPSVTTPTTTSTRLTGERLDELHHVAIQVEELDRAVSWYQEHFRCEIKWHDATWALLKFANTSLALVMPGEHPPHIAFSMEDAARLGPLQPHRDGTRSIYIEDGEGNTVECLDAESL